MTYEDGAPVLLRDDLDQCTEEVSRLGQDLLLAAPDRLNLGLVDHPDNPHTAGEFRADFILGEGLVEEPTPSSHYVGILLYKTGVQVATLPFSEHEDMLPSGVDRKDLLEYHQTLFERLACIDFFSLSIPEYNVQFEGVQSGLSGTQLELLTSVMQHPELEEITRFEKMLQYVHMVGPVAGSVARIRQQESNEFMARKIVEFENS